MEYPEIDYKAIEEYHRKEALKNIRNFDYKDLKSDYNLFMIFFYWFKTYICLLLKRTKLKTKYDIIIVTYNEYSYPDGISWEYVSVGEGIFKNWQTRIGTDGN